MTPRAAAEFRNVTKTYAGPGVPWVLALTVLLGSCTPPPLTAPATTPLALASPLARPPEAWWDALRSRPLALPRLATDGSCPVSTERAIRPHESAQELQVLGEGPAYPGIRSRTKYEHASTWRARDGRVYHKGLWIVEASYLGPVLARGGRIDGSGDVHFDDAQHPPTDELRIGPSPGGYRDRPSSWSASGLGCYALQIDGLDFTTYVVFAVMP